MLLAGLDIEWTITGEPIEACAAPGETINFNWEGPYHNVVDLGRSQHDYDECIFGEDQTEAVEGPWSTTVGEAGHYYYVCGVLGHCAEGMQKAYITVQEGGC